MDEEQTEQMDIDTASEKALNHLENLMPNVNWSALDHRWAFAKAYSEVVNAEVLLGAYMEMVDAGDWDAVQAVHRLICAALEDYDDINRAVMEQVAALAEGYNTEGDD